MPFRDRTHAGEELALRMLEWADSSDLVDPVVLALPRGGVPVAAPVAHALHAPLDVLVARKIGVPGRRETAIGAVVGEEPPLFDRVALELLGLSEDGLGSDVAEARAELHRRAHVYRTDRPAPPVENRTVIVVDDGLATGLTATAALLSLHRRGADRLVLAAPVGSPQTVADLRGHTGDVICLEQPADFHAVSEGYDRFPQVSDAEVMDVLNAFHAREDRHERSGRG
ncbi:phosphoribosyltransferase family protein [Streptomyces sp. NBC_00006]|uniref:phosphoribosyltransferase n=1 Tax=Streptomyces sp. NBC_00006 TaxID=2975619 RepID=UPI002253CC26|nr:phosphoribosyltransferase family protein [Streptomyces sp. NBC_00006]MCX5536231.1 phosphoribosyltransferase family protein [Streptomyces sp. NBC_00006]